MAGHSKWANIKHRKAAQDAKRGKVFTKIIRELTVAARLGGGDPADNPRLRAAVDKALGVNMPRDTVDRAIKRGAGDTDADNLMELVYEGYGPSGVAILVEAMTDNKNRTVAEVRHAFSKAGGSLGTSGSVAYLFNQQGQLYFAPGTDEEKLMEAALEAGAEDIHSHPDGTLEVITSANSFGEVKDQLAAAGFTSVSAEVTKVADNYIDLDQETSNKVLKLMDMLEDLDDTQNVYCNANFADDLSS